MSALVATLAGSRTEFSSCSVSRCTQSLSGIVGNRPLAFCLPNFNFRFLKYTASVSKVSGILLQIRFLMIGKGNLSSIISRMLFRTEGARRSTFPVVFFPQHHSLLSWSWAATIGMLEINTNNVECCRVKVPWTGHSPCTSTVLGLSVPGLLDLFGHTALIFEVEHI